MVFRRVDPRLPSEFAVPYRQNAEDIALAEISFSPASSRYSHQDSTLLVSSPSSKVSEGLDLKLANKRLCQKVVQVAAPAPSVSIT